MTDQAPKITAIVVNFNAGEALCACVGAILREPMGADVVVFDNASLDGSMDSLERRLGSHPRLSQRHSTVNLGFARAVNACAREVTAQFVLVINPDCELAAGALPALADALAADPRAGLAAPRVLRPDGTVEPASLRRFPRPWNSLVTVTGLWRLGRWQPRLRGCAAAQVEGVGETVRAEAVSGACMLIRQNALQEVGFLDEGYAMHCEDLDLMRRLSLAGWHCLYVPSAHATHDQGLSSRERPLWVHRQKHRGMARYYRKFLAQRYPLPVSWLVAAGIWLHYLVFLPRAWLRR